MAEQTLTRADIAAQLHRNIGVSRIEAQRLVDSIIGHMTKAVLAGENVKLSGFGTFVLRDKRERIGRNPKTGVEVPIAPRTVVTFRPSQTLRQRVA